MNGGTALRAASSVSSAVENLRSIAMAVDYQAGEGYCLMVCVSRSDHEQAKATVKRERLYTLRGRLSGWGGKCVRGHGRIFCVEGVVERSPFELSRGDNLWSGLGFLFPWCFVFGDSDHVC